MNLLVAPFEPNDAKRCQYVLEQTPHTFTFQTGQLLALGATARLSESVLPISIASFTIEGTDPKSAMVEKCLPKNERKGVACLT